MTTTLALFLDSYRELNSKRLFWISLAVSLIVVVAFGAVGIDGPTLTLFGWHTPYKFAELNLVSHSTFYKFIFAKLGVGIWLSWFASILALVSTAGIFPDFMAGGSIDLYLSKPISRLRLFASKFAGGLFFVGLQVSLFCVSCFLLLGLRGVGWEPAIFLAVPLVLLMFSYLYAICILVGVITRSTIASLLVTLVLWACLVGAQGAEFLLLQGANDWHQRASELDARIESLQEQIEANNSSPARNNPAATTAPVESLAQSQAATKPAASAKSTSLIPDLSSWLGFGSPSQKSVLRQQLVELQQRREQTNPDRFDLAFKIMHGVNYLLPKTGATIDILDRSLIKLADLPDLSQAQASPNRDSEDRPGPPRRRRRAPIGQAEIDKIRHAPSTEWVLGTSILFEAVTLCAAAWLFCRRDY